jgi:tetratricopeptide (TPR) repeat protein
MLNHAPILLFCTSEYAMIKSLTTILFLMGFAFVLNAQESKEIIGLKQKVAVAKNDTMLVMLYNNLAREYSKSNFDSVQHYTHKCVYAAKRSGNSKALYLANNTAGAFHVMKGEHLDSAIFYLNEAIRIAKILKRPGDEAASLYNLSYVYLTLNLFDKSLKINIDLLKIREKTGDTPGLINSYNGIAIVLVKMHRYNEGLVYAEKALKMAQENKIESSIMSSYINLGTVYLGLKKNNEAEDCFMKARNLAIKNRDMISYSDALTNLGAVYMEKGELTKAKSTFRELIATGILEQQDPYTSNILYYNFGEIYTKENNPDSAIFYYNKALSYSQPVKNYEGIFSAYYGIAQAEFVKKNYQAAFDNLNKAYSYRDSVFTEEKDRTISELKIGYEVDKKEEENKILTKDSELKDLRISQQFIIIASLGALLILIVVGGFYFYRQRRIIAQQREKLLEQKLLQMQLNPHFIFNSLQAIQDYIYNNNEREASQYLSKFARLMRLTLENSRHENILLKKEIEGLDNYLALQKLRLGDKLEYEITISDDIDPTFTEVPPMLIQPFVENAVEHGIKMKDGLGKVSVAFSMDNDLLTIKVIDNGPGFVKKEDLNGEHQSLSMQIISERLELFGKKKKQKPQLIITNLGKTNSGGTQIEIKLPTEV